MTVRRAMIYDLVGPEHVTGAMALEMLSTRGIVPLDDERKAAMVSNLLVVLCGERSTQPVINAGLRALALLLPFITEVWQIYVLIFLLQSASAAFTPTFQATTLDVPSWEV